MNYYLTKHWPLVEQVWGPYGLISWTVTTATKDTEYAVQATMIFRSLEAWKGIGRKDLDEIMDDIPNFTESKPKQWIGTVVRSKMC